jgi:hypothetical protein
MSELMPEVCLEISQDSMVRIATDYGPDNGGLGVGVPEGARLLHGVQTGSGANPTTYPMGTWSKAAGA